MRASILFGVATLLVWSPASLWAQNASDPRPVVHFYAGGRYGDRTSLVAVGEIVNIHGRDFGQRQGKWVVEIFRGNKTYHLPVLDWTPTRVRVRVPDTVAPATYTLHFVVPGRLLQSNQQQMIVRARGGAGALSGVYPTTVYPGQVLHLYFSGVQQGDIPQAYAQIKPARGGSFTDMEVLLRKSRYLKVKVPEGLRPGNYEVSVSIPGVPLGSKPITDIQSSGTRFSEVLRIDAVESADTRAITAGQVVHILGDGFGYQREKKVVEFVEAVRGRAVRHPMAVNERNWHDEQIILRIPPDFKPGDYLVRVWDNAKNRSSNTIKVSVVAPTAARISRQTRPGDADSGRGLSLDALEPKAVAAGSMLVLRGANFGPRQGDKIVAINHNGHSNRMVIVEWSDQRIRARVPAGLDPGEYRVLIYADASRRTSSNSLAVTIRRPRANGAGLDLLAPLDMNGSARSKDLFSDAAAGIGAAAAQPQRPKKVADLAAVSITHLVRRIDLPMGRRSFGDDAWINQDVIVAEVKNLSKFKYVGERTLRLSEGTVRRDGSIADNPRVLLTKTIPTLPAGDNYLVAVDVGANYRDPKIIYILEISRGDNNPDNDKITKQFKKLRKPQRPLP